MTMRGIVRFLTVLLLAWGVTDASGQRRPAVKLSPPVVKQSPSINSSIAISLVALGNGPSVPGGATGQGTMQLGKVSSGGGARIPGVVVGRRPHSMVVRTVFGVRLDYGVSTGSAKLSAFLLQPDSRYQIFVDGVKLGASAQLIQAGVRYGAVTQHRLEIEVPKSLPENEARIADNIGFLAVPE